jgi:hypothetical protein
MSAPEVWQAYFSRAKGCRVWDLEGREFIDMSIMSEGACILGYSDDEVEDAVWATINRGGNNSLNRPEEGEPVQALLELHPRLGVARFCRSVRNAMVLAVEACLNFQAASAPIECLTDNGAAYTARETPEFLPRINLITLFTPVRSPQSSGIVESFVETFKREYVYVHDRPDVKTVLAQLGRWFNDQNEGYPHKGL